MFLDFFFFFLNLSSIINYIIMNQEEFFFFFLAEQNDVKFYLDMLLNNVLISKNKLEINIIMIILK